MRKLRQGLPLLVIAFVLTISVGVVLGFQVSDYDLTEAAQAPPVIPEEAKQRENPYAGDADARAKGELYFSSQCTMCHGVDGRGTGDLVERLQLEIPDFTDREMQAEWTDGAMFYLINEGHGAMPGQKKRFDDEIKWGMVNHVRSFAGDDGGSKGR